MSDQHCLYELLFPNSKRYFGITNDFVRRMREHRLDAKASDLVVYRAIRKYGWENDAAVYRAMVDNHAGNIPGIILGGTS